LLSTSAPTNCGIDDIACVFLPSSIPLIQISEGSALGWRYAAVTNEDSPIKGEQPYIAFDCTFLPLAVLRLFASSFSV